jgi:hypothetical protein
MLKLKRFLGMLFLPALFSGCTTTTITNLTPSVLPRNTDGQYPVEMEITSNQQTLRDNSIKPFVVVGFDFYPMQRTLLMKNRWETLVPIPSDQNVIHYRFKLDYDYNKMGGQGHGSKMSTEYKLSLKD